jgi:hypothetical protein
VLSLALLISVVAALAILIAMAVTTVVRRQTRDSRARDVGGGWGGQGLRGEDAFVPVGPPRKPSPAAAVAIPLPDPEPETIDAYGHELAGGKEDADALASLQRPVGAPVA